MDILKEELYSRYFAAALAGLLAAEKEGWHFNNRAEAASAAGKVADFSLMEHAKRFGPPNHDGNHNSSKPGGKP